MSVDRTKLKNDAMACLGQDKPAGELVECVSRHFPDLEVNRQQDDLVIKGGQRFLIVRRVAANRFKVSDNVAAPSTNLVDFGGGTERDIDQLIDELSTLAN